MEFRKPLWVAAWVAWLSAAAGSPWASQAAGLAVPAWVAGGVAAVCLWGAVIAAGRAARAETAQPTRSAATGPWWRGAALACLAAAVFARGFAFVAAVEGRGFAREGERVTAVGWVREAAPTPWGTRVVLEARVDAAGGPEASAGRARRLAVLVELPRRAVEVGEGWQVRGRLARLGPARNPGAFDPRSYWLPRGVAWELKAPSAEPRPDVAGPLWRRSLARLRGALARALDRTLPPDLAGLARSLALGDRAGLTEDERAAFRWAGASHVLAVSGMHVALLVSWLSALPLGARTAVRTSAAALALVYVALVGAPASAVRALLMLLWSVAAECLGRPNAPFQALGASALLLLLWDPPLWRDAGFQLSVLATAGVLWAAPWSARRFRNLGRALGWAAGTLAVGTAAVAVSAPAALWAFGWAAWWAPLTGLAILPLTALAMPLSLAGALAAGLGVSGAVLRPEAWVLRAVQVVVEYCGALGRALPPMGPGGFVAAAAALGAVWAARAARRAGVLSGPVGPGARFPPRRAAAVGAAVAALAVVAAILVLRVPASSRLLEVTFLDVGEGDAAVVRTPSGRWLVIDGGNLRLAPRPSPDERPGALADYLTYRRVRRIHILFSTHPDADHLYGLVPVVERWPVDLVMDPGATAADDGWRRFASAIAARGLQRARPFRGWTARLPDGVELDVLNPPRRAAGLSDNDRGLVVRLVYGAVGFLFAADVEAGTEASMVRSGACLASTVLKVPHHGSRTSSTDAFVRAVAPRFAVVSVGPNPYGLPNGDVLRRYRDAGVAVLRTDRGGAVRFRTDGRQLWLARGAGPWRRVPGDAAAGDAVRCRERQVSMGVAQP